MANCGLGNGKCLDAVGGAMIKTWHQRCEEHPEHEGIVTEQMIRDRMQEEIDELRKEIARIKPRHERDGNGAGCCDQG